MKMYVFLLVVILHGCILMPGCVYVPKETVLLARDVDRVQSETSDVLIKVIDSDLPKNPKGSNGEKFLLNLRERLDYLKRANRVLSKTMSNKVSLDELSLLLVEKNKMEKMPK
ncbi:MAG: hypothetical protein WC755_01930 [Candidatus Woesearchaeota archaeon]|jgi:hypothetical protein